MYICVCMCVCMSECERTCVGMSECELACVCIWARALQACVLCRAESVALVPGSSRVGGDTALSVPEESVITLENGIHLCQRLACSAGFR